MTTTIRLMTVVTVLAVLGAVTQSAQAVLIKNVTTNTVLFDAGGFEAGSPGSTVGANDPAVGTWANINNAGGHIQVHNFFTDGSVTAFDGDKFLRMNRATANTELFTSGFTGSTSDVITISFAALVTTGAANVHIRDAQGNRIANMFLNDSQLNAGTGAAPVILLQGPGLANQWITFEYTYINGANTYDVSINGGAPQTVNVFDGPGVISSIVLRTGAAGNAYYDAIPEPAGIALMGLGGMLLLRRGRRS
jgi:hypothetical protein